MNTNLDTMDEAQLWEFWSDNRRAGANARRALFGRIGPGTVKACKALANYAANKATAQGLRTRGDITGALQYERICDSIYKTLPSYATW